MWKEPQGLMRGLLLWAIVVPVGQLLRVLTYSGNLTLPFILVSAVTLALFLISWHLINTGLQMLNRQPRHD
ncbi:MULTISPECIES: DUF3054 domain-containing protein [unclassified Corynebacterium]|uniref:DUF3054 domain-containing protein n=1 Tax=unclassified Corynebacterium TaxID=2624378 RepID=UPI00211BCD31|nr:DUF3054 domain-containing protein [Corynebacterium sp. 35RC1]